MNFSHKPVLLEETIDSLNINPDGIYVDGTAGGGGHSYEILKRLSPINKIKPPIKKPLDTISDALIFNSFDNSIAGNNNEKNEAAIIIPAANPNIPSKNT